MGTDGGCDVGTPRNAAEDGRDVGTGSAVVPARSPEDARPWLMATLRRHTLATLLRSLRMAPPAALPADADGDGGDAGGGPVGFWNGGDWASNFHPAPFMVDWDGDLPSGWAGGRVLRMGCSEQWFMFRKAWRFADADAMAALLEPGLAPIDYKRVGRSVRGFDPAVWDRESDWWMLEALVFKFTQDPRLAALLAGTGGRLLVECSPFDRVWGMGLGVEDRDGNPDGRWRDPFQWRGANRLGFRLMDLRDALLAGGPERLSPAGRLR